MTTHRPDQEEHDGRGQVQRTGHVQHQPVVGHALGRVSADQQRQQRVQQHGQRTDESGEQPIRFLRTILTWWWWRVVVGEVGRRVHRLGRGLQVANQRRTLTKLTRDSSILPTVYFNRNK